MQCDGDYLVFACINHGNVRQPFGIDCTGEELGGAEGRCFNQRCIQPTAGGICNPDLVTCIGGRDCVDIDEETNVGRCR